MNPADTLLLARLDRATRGARALLCTLARRGKALRHDEPARADLLLVACQGHPLYKAGRLLFDLLELEDLMLDGEAPPPLGGAELATEVRRVAGAAGELWGALEKLVGEAAAALASPRAEPAGEEPALEPESPAPDPPAAEPEPPAALPPASPAPPELPEPLPELTAAEYLYDLVVVATLDELARALAERPRVEPSQGEEGKAREEEGEAQESP